MLKTLVAGGAGFIGSNLIDALLLQGHSVVCVDNFSIGCKSNIEHLTDNPQFKLYKSNIEELQILRNIFDSERPEYVFHLAANSDIQASTNNPCIEMNNTMVTTFNLLMCMREFGAKKMFFSSTSAVYGEKPGVKFSEEFAVLSPISYYGAAKLASEAFISAFAHMNDLDALIFRFPNVIGERLTHGVIFDFAKKLKNDPSQLEILGDGSQCKPYMHVRDLVAAIMKMKSTPKGVETYNIGLESKTTVTEIANIICEEMGLEGVNYIYTGGKIGWKGDVPTFDYDLSKIHSTGWHSSMTSNEAVVATIRAFTKERT